MCDTRVIKESPLPSRNGNEEDSSTTEPANRALLNYVNFISLQQRYNPIDLKEPDRSKMPDSQVLWPVEY